MQTADRLLLSLFMLMFLIVLLKRAEPAQALPLVKADFPLCVTMRPGPLDKPHRTISGRAPVSGLS